MTTDNVPHPADRAELPDVYPDAFRAATAVLESSGLLHVHGGRELVDRTVATVLGAALLELERPWRERLGELEAEREAARDLAVALEGRGELAEQALRGIARTLKDSTSMRARAVRALEEIDGTAPTAAEVARVGVDLEPDPVPDTLPPARVLGVRLALLAELVDTIGEEPIRRRVAEAVMREIEFIDAAAKGVRSLDDDDGEDPDRELPWYCVQAGDTPSHDHEHDDRETLSGRWLREHLVDRHRQGLDLTSPIRDVKHYVAQLGDHENETWHHELHARERDT